MPIKVPNALPAVAQQEAENIFVMTGKSMISVSTIFSSAFGDTV